MLEIVQNQLKDQLNSAEPPHFLLACSGGVDSMVLFDLLLKLDYSFTVAHCNFQLRGKESDADQDFVNTHCESKAVPFVTKAFSTKTFHLERGVSIQMAARELRYDWFNTLIKTGPYTHLLTAHHLNDQIETFLINLSRASGLKGLCGMPTDRVLRPLLSLTKEQILNYAEKEKIQWREDASNASDDYLRNQLRHHLLPQWKAITPTIQEQLGKSIEKLARAEAALNEQVKQFRAHHFESIDGHIRVSLTALRELKPQAYYLHALFSPFGFHHLNDLIDLLQAQSGKKLISKTHRLIRDRAFLLLDQLTNEDLSSADVFYWTPDHDLTHPIALQIQEIHEESKQTAFLDENALKYPLILRKYQEGDYFYPTGMQGKKKLSKFFKDQKYSLLEKEQQWLLCSENDIVWVIGQRVDARFAASENTINPLKIQCH